MENIEMAEHSRQLFFSPNQAIVSVEDQDNIITVGINFKAILSLKMGSCGGFRTTVKNGKIVVKNRSLKPSSMLVTA